MTDDFEALLQLESAVFPEPWGEVAIREVLSDEKYLAFVERDEQGTAFGYLIGWQIGDEAELARIGVLPALRRRGLGAQILDKGLVLWRQQGANRVFLEVRESNVAAQRLYESRGFKLVGRRKNYYATNENALVMHLEFLDL